MISSDELIQVLTSRNPSANVPIVRQAYDFAQKAHEKQKRASGEPYFEHPAAVAMILAQMHLDTTSVVTGLLHDTVEDTDVTLEDIKQLFGTEVAFLVHSVTKLSRVRWRADHGARTSQFHKLLIGMARDMRALLVKLADRLHNMRTLCHLSSPQKQQRIARETLEIYAPLAERIGVQGLKDEMEDIATRVLFPDLYQAIVEKITETRQKNHIDIEAMCLEIHTVLNQHNIQATVTGRTKTPHSIIKKMERKNMTFEQLADLLAFRVVVEDKTTCYQALGALHEAYVILPARFKDYISIPKVNGYQSLHTGLIGPLQQRVEVQIRTQAMDDIAHYGIAAHWWHKNADQALPPPEYAWLRHILESVEHHDNPEEVLGQACLEMSSQEVHCFTPKNRLITLPAGATGFDFAYAVHTWVGDHCVSVKINDRLMPLRTQLAHGDIVEIITSETSLISPEWARFAVTSHARARMRRIARAQKRAQYILLGRRVFEKELSRHKKNLIEHDILPHLESFQCETMDDFWMALGQGLWPLTEVLAQIYPQHTWKSRKAQKRFYRGSPCAKINHLSSESIPLTGLTPGLAIRYAGCCYPLPGDRILGILVSRRGVTVHKEECTTLDRYAMNPDRILNLSWKKGGGDQKFVGRLTTRMLNQPGNLAAIAHIMSSHGANIINLKITQRTPEFFDFVIETELSSAEHLKNMMTLLKTHPAVCSMERF